MAGSNDSNKQKASRKGYSVLMRTFVQELMSGCLEESITFTILEEAQLKI